ncbi:MAG TPA: monovalent cation/H(+) antiporter subunit G [Beijerinckiaceae bacterium]|jgi:multicomponent K+:H+ antiporter subunit G
MSAAADAPLWAAIVVSVLLLGGSLLTLIGALGLLRMATFYERIHAPTLGTTLGMMGVLAASAVYFTATGGRFVAHEILIAIFVTLTTPVTLMLLGRAALYRDRREGRVDGPEA